ncbi:MAG: hypothetical protein OEY44_02540 [Candidatus Peregrinibacteria bacterium]|nr:hypothetical protein [Candidatus Peregrinibacteria bacterium]
MTKKLTIIGSILLSISYGLLSWSLITYSQSPDPADSPYADRCGAKDVTERAVATDQYDMCCIDYNTAMDAARTDWENHLDQLIDQEKPASEMTGEAYESLRTYNCWLEYICRSVEYSTRAEPKSALGGLTSDQIGVVPGCQAPEDILLEVEVNNFFEALKQIPVVGILPSEYDDLFVANRVNYFPSCYVGTRGPLVAEIDKNYSQCKASISQYFNCTEENFRDGDNSCLNGSQPFVMVEGALKKANADQKARVLEKKLSTVVSKLQTMESHMGYFSNFLQQLDARFACYAKECS